ncbi:Vacuolar protein sorting-associated protein 8 [Ceratocystis pirilliformis]|uniref:Vacuolar protein sorting-associated protein 8 n=1 Tax=Ceratocystis pirilliformis TaxID=259994 RepID=A0ABR3ZFL3_9PEZI
MDISTAGTHSDSPHSGSPHLEQHNDSAQTSSAADEPHIEQSFEDDNRDDGAASLLHTENAYSQSQIDINHSGLAQDVPSWASVALPGSSSSSINASEIVVQGDNIANVAQPPQSPQQSIKSDLDDAASIQGSFLSSPRSSILPSAALHRSDTGSPARGTSKGFILMFDYSQNLKGVIGSGTKAIECGAVTSIAISADHSTVAGGHMNGSIFTWETSKPTRTFLSIPPIAVTDKAERTSDGHMPDFAVIHLGFLGTRRTALVSADNRGMAFSHLATRGTGALGRMVKTNRILGRYPDALLTSTERPVKPSTVLAFAPLPLGNAERATDSMGLTAMLTPYLLVIVSTTPVAQTQHKVARPKNAGSQSSLSGCLSWFPAGKLKVADAESGSDISKAKLVYCWSNILSVMDVDEILPENPNKPSTLEFRTRNRWKCDEAIVAVQWLSRSVITVLTATQRLVVIEDRSMRVTDAFDLLHKSIYNVDFFSQQLRPLIGQVDAQDDGNNASTHSVVCDAFYMSLKVFKGRFFLLGIEDLSIGALSNWYDRLVALMNNGDYVASMQLAISYYTGDSDKLTVGLPEDATIRQSIVSSKAFDLMAESLAHIATRRKKDSTCISESTLKDLADVFFLACKTLENIDFLFDVVYDWYEENSYQGLFLETLEKYIVAEAITVVPPVVMKALVSHYVEKGMETRLEEMICHVEPSTLDLDQITALCKQHGLYDALIYVWNTGLGDYITPLIDLLDLLVHSVSLQESALMQTKTQGCNEVHIENAAKIFPYLAYTLTGRVYPMGDMLMEKDATKAKSEIYWFLFSGNSVEWPRGSKQKFITCPDRPQEPSFPYLRLILRFDAPSFLSAMNEAFEDSFLNDSPDKQIGANIGGDVPEEQVFGLTVDRQYIVSILLELMGPSVEFSPSDTIYLDMFIARNLSKFQQYLIFPGSTLTKVLTELCRYSEQDLVEDAQLSAEYLLSVYHPPDMDVLMPLLREASFYRILKRIYLSNREYESLVEVYLEDPYNQISLFDCLADCLRTAKSLTLRQRDSLYDAISKHASALIQLDPQTAAITFATQNLSLHRRILDSTMDFPHAQYMYLKTLLEPDASLETVDESVTNDQDLVELYVRLMCTHDASHVCDYITLHHVPNLRLHKLLETLEDTGVVDAVVILMASQGLIKDAMARLVKHLETLEVAFRYTFTGSNHSTNIKSTADDLLQSVQKFIHVGIWLCNKQQVLGTPFESAKSKAAITPAPKRSSMIRGEPLSETESLWLTLIRASVQMTKSLSLDIDDFVTSIDLDRERLEIQVRSLVQHVFTALLTATANLNLGVKTSHSVDSNVTFLRILQAFLTDEAVSSPSLADLRSVLSSIFAAYAYEESILQLSHRLLNQSLFLSMTQSIQLKQRGWRPRSSTCEACGRRLWGPGVSGNIYKAWELKQVRKAEEQRNVTNSARGLVDSRGKSKVAVTESNKLASGHHDEWPAPSSIQLQQQQQEQQLTTDYHPGNANPTLDTTGQDIGVDRGQDLDDIVLFACRHIYHRKCLETESSTMKCPRLH